LALSRSLGDADLQPFVTYKPEVYFVDLSTGEYRFLIIACDGLWDVVSNQKAIEIVDRYPEPTRAAAALRDYAYLLGSTDNISVIVYRFDSDRRDQINRNSEEREGIIIEDDIQLQPQPNSLPTTNNTEKPGDISTVDQVSQSNL